MKSYRTDMRKKLYILSGIKIFNNFAIQIVNFDSKYEKVSIKLTCPNRFYF